MRAKVVDSVLGGIAAEDDPNAESDQGEAADHRLLINALVDEKRPGLSEAARGVVKKAVEKAVDEEGAPAKAAEKAPPAKAAEKAPAKVVELDEVLGKAPAQAIEKAPAEQPAEQAPRASAAETAVAAEKEPAKIVEYEGEVFGKAPARAIEKAPAEHEQAAEQASRASPAETAVPFFYAEKVPAMAAEKAVRKAPEKAAEKAVEKAPAKAAEKEPAKVVEYDEVYEVFEKPPARAIEKAPAEHAAEQAPRASAAEKAVVPVGKAPAKAAKNAPAKGAFSAIAEKGPAKVVEYEDVDVFGKPPARAIEKAPAEHVAPEQSPRTNAAEKAAPVEKAPAPRAAGKAVEKAPAKAAKKAVEKAPAKAAEKVAGKAPAKAVGNPKPVVKAKPRMKAFANALAVARVMGSSRKKAAEGAHNLYFTSSQEEELLGSVARRNYSASREESWKHTIPKPEKPSFPKKLSSDRKQQLEAAIRKIPSVVGAARTGAAPPNDHGPGGGTAPYSDGGEDSSDENAVVSLSPAPSESLSPSPRSELGVREVPTPRSPNSPDPSEPELSFGSPVPSEHDSAQKPRKNSAMSSAEEEEFSACVPKRLESKLLLEQRLFGNSSTANPTNSAPTARSVAKSTITNINFLRKQQLLLHFRRSVLFPPSTRPAAPAPPTPPPLPPPPHLPPLSSPPSTTPLHPPLHHPSVMRARTS